MILIRKKNLLAFGNSVLSYIQGDVCVKASEKSGICTPYFRSLAEKVELKISGRIEKGTEVNYVVYSYDENGTENTVFLGNMIPSQGNRFDISYSFDPISLGVYQNAVKFRVALYGVSEKTEIYISNFSLEEENDKRENKNYDSHNNITSDAAGQKCAYVMKKNGEKIIVPVIPKKVLFIGNSILLGMFNTYGMCATSPKADYAYLVQEKILQYNKDCIFYKLHGSGFEHSESLAAFEEWFSRDANIYTGKPVKESFLEDLDLIFIQLTDNINTDGKRANFKQSADLLIERIKELSPNARIIWIHGWYNKNNTLDKLAEVCRRWGIERVDISDLHTKENESYSGQISWSPGEGEATVKDSWITHPGDKGMKEIAQRIMESVGI